MVFNPSGVDGKGTALQRTEGIEPLTGEFNFDSAGFDMDGADAQVAGTVANAGAERLGAGLLRREARGEVLGRVGPRRAVGLLGRGEAPLGEPGMALEGPLDAVDLDEIDADLRSLIGFAVKVE